MSNESLTEKLQELFGLLQSGALSQEEYDQLKLELLQSKSTSISDASNDVKINSEKNPNELLEDKNQIQETPAIGAGNSFRNESQDGNLAETLNTTLLIANEKTKSKSKFILLGIIILLVIAGGAWILLKTISATDADKNADLAKMNLSGKVRSITEKFEFKGDDDGEGTGDGVAMDESYPKIIYTFNKSGNIDSKIYYSVSGIDNLVIDIKNEYTYNDKYQPVEEAFFANNGKCIQRTKFTYNEKGVLIQTNNSECDECADTLFGYDMVGNLITKTVSNNGDDYIINITYDAKGRKIGEKNDVTYLNDYSFTNDDNGRLIERCSYGVDGSTI